MFVADDKCYYLQGKALLLAPYSYELCLEDPLEHISLKLMMKVKREPD